MKPKYVTPKRVKFWMLARPNGDWVGDGDAAGDSPFTYTSRQEAIDSGWNVPGNPCRPVKVELRILVQG